MPATTVSKRVILLTTTITLVVVFLIATLIPFSYFSFGLKFHQGQMSIQSQQLAKEISTIISQSPNLWEFRTDHIEDLVYRSVGATTPQRILLLNNNEDIVLIFGSSIETLGFPVVKHAEPIYDSGRQVATLHFQHSLSDLLYKTILVFLVSSLFSILIFFTLRSLPLRNLKKSLEDLSYMAAYDSLTGAPNRETFSNVLNNAEKDANEHGRKFAVFALDIDKFKEINDSLGHFAGDEVLKEATRRLQSCIREKDTLARLSGDEFAILQSDISSIETATQVAQRIVDVFSKPMGIVGQKLNVTTSAGIALYPQDANSASDIMINADLALYRVKETSRGDYVFFDTEMTNTRLRRKSIELELQKAIINQQFKVYYQPQVSLSSGKVVGVEALVRWIHPKWGFVSPEEFISVAEDTGMIHTLGSWVLQQACSDAISWKGIKLSVNLSPRQFHKNTLVGDIYSTLMKTGFPAKRLDLEITEGVLISDNDSAYELIAQLKSLGVSISMDDFGTGYSSLSYIHAFPFDKLKIDRSFVSTEKHNKKKEAIIRAAVGLGASLGMRVNAEGVETQEQSLRLQRLGCDEAQGYLFSPAVPAHDIPALIESDFADKVRPIRNTNIFRFN